nr:uncharacterized protein LOC129267177 [Lytechinus pictus]
MSDYWIGYYHSDLKWRTIFGACLLFLFLAKAPPLPCLQPRYLFNRGSSYPSKEKILRWSAPISLLRMFALSSGNTKKHELRLSGAQLQVNVHLIFLILQSTS